MMVQEDRDRVLAAAQSWLGTPFHDCAQVKGVGVDCANILAAVYAEAGLVPEVEIAAYSPQFMLHSSEPLFESYVRRFADEVEEAVVQPADIVLYQVGRSFAHGAIIVDWPTKIIHAFKSFGRVAETGAFEADLLGRKTKFFSIR